MSKSRLAFSTIALLLAGCITTGCCVSRQADVREPEGEFASWTQGPPADRDFFPIAVWLQDPADAEAYKAAGVNTFVGLWEGPTEAQLAALKKAGMKVICEVNGVALKHLHDPTIVGWMHGDEPDNAQSSPGKDAAGKPLANEPVPPAKIIAEYQKYRRMDPTRPIMLNLGQGVANDTWPGRGKDNGNLEVYKDYVKGGDIISFDIYPVSGNRNPDRGNLSQEAKGINRIREWTAGDKIVWNCIECTQINGERPEKITPQQMQSCVWISLIHGSTGIIYFCHQFEGKEPSPKHLLLDPPMLAAATEVNREIKELAPVLNSPTVSDVAKVTSPLSLSIQTTFTAIPYNPPAPPPAPVSLVDIMVKQYGGSTYIFACGMVKENAHATIHVNGLAAEAKAEVMGESRTVAITNGDLQDDFAPFAIHRYVIKPAL